MPLVERDPQLAAGQVRAEAAVHAAAEREVAVHVAVEANVERRRAGGLVDVGGADHHQHRVARRDRAAVRQLGVLRRHPR